LFNARFFEVEAWLDNTHSLIWAGEARTGSMYSFYLVDITTPNSLKTVASQYAYKPLYLPDPSRFYWVTMDTPGDFYATDTVQQSMHRYELGTDTETLLFSHPCEFRYCEAGYVVWGDDNLIVTRNGYPLDYDFPATIWDARSGQALYSIIADTIYFLDKDTFLFAGYDPNAESFLFREVSVKNGVPEETILSKGYDNFATEVTLSPDKDYALILASGDQIYGIDVYNLKHQRQYTLVAPLTNDDYALQYSWQDKGMLQIDLLEEQACKNLFVPCTLGSWLVRVPDESAAS
jgi:hypothetical protein